MKHTFIVLLTLIAIAPVSADPKSHYMIHCMGCHLASGEGMPPEVPSFDKNLGFLAKSEAGRRYLVQVPGASQSLIDDAALAALMNWMIEEYAPGTRAPEYTESEIQSYRTQTLADPKAERARLFANHQ